jgi:hypothetical protein
MLVKISLFGCSQQLRAGSCARPETFAPQSAFDPSPGSPCFGPRCLVEAVFLSRRRRTQPTVTAEFSAAFCANSFTRCAGRLRGLQKRSFLETTALSLRQKFFLRTGFFTLRATYPYLGKPLPSSHRWGPPPLCGLWWQRNSDPENNKLISVKPNDRSPLTEMLRPVGRPSILWLVSVRCNDQ